MTASSAFEVFVYLSGCIGASVAVLMSMRLWTALIEIEMKFLETYEDLNVLSNSQDTRIIQLESDIADISKRVTAIERRLHEQTKTKMM